MRVLRGLHGFHVFAYEHWIDCVLYALSPSDTREDMTHLLEILSEVSQKLAVPSGSATTQNENTPVSEPKLELLRQFPPLFLTAKEFLLARNQKKASQVNSDSECSALRTLPVYTYLTLRSKTLYVKSPSYEMC